MPIRRQDILDSDIIDAVELASLGTTPYLSSVSVISTTSGTNTVALSGVRIITDFDTAVVPGDLIVLSGTGGADGNYIVATVVDDTTITTTTALVSTTGGTANFIYPVGGSRVASNTTGFAWSASSDVQSVLKDLDAAITATHVNVGTLDVVLPQHYDYVDGTVTGLTGTPTKVFGSAIYEEGVTVQSGIQYLFTTSNFVSGGFSWHLRVLGDEFWPGPSSVTLKIDYLWVTT
jgi:hypothetical protein